MLQLLFAVAFSAAPLTLYVPPIRSLNPFVEALEMFFREVAVYSQRAYPRIRLGISRILAVASRSLRLDINNLRCASGGSEGGIMEAENEWEKLLKPFDLEALRDSFNFLTPVRLCKLLELPLDISTSMQLFQWAGAQRGYSHTFDVYYALVRKLAEAGEFSTVDQLLRQSMEERIVLKEPLFLLIMSCHGKSGLPGAAVQLLDEMPDRFG